jgi:hypothetical protein
VISDRVVIDDRQFYPECTTSSLKKNQTQKNRFISKLKMRQNQKTKGSFLEQRSKQQCNMPWFN